MALTGSRPYGRVTATGTRAAVIDVRAAHPCGADRAEARVGARAAGGAGTRLSAPAHR
ncbi:hypothetical protein SAMN04489764_3051 [Thermostaphylospora chromogena]|uniref:Uncharacterized protein n=1 Tax=Thermostaphylospora chromogena TaxID=35622 RepID=A0A1H1FLS4_9ACTN|nr:hypothetical protein SAMN04489764_3051 [Thermostaphylospora chromogena]